MQTTTSTYQIASYAANYHRIATAGRYQVVDGRTVWATREGAEAAVAAVLAGQATASPQTAEHAARMSGAGACHYCGLPTRRGVCAECGTEI